MIRKELIDKYNSKIPLNELFNLNIKNSVETNSWFDITESDTYEFKNKLKFEKYEKVDKIIFCRKIILLPTPKQKIKLLSWLNLYRKMYNKTLQFLNKNGLTKSWTKIRTYHMKKYKKVLMKKNNVPSHVLDYAIKSVCSSFKSSITNLKNKNIKHFKIRYLKKDKNSHILDLEKSCFREKSFYTTMLGKVLKNKSNFLYNTITADSKLHYNMKSKQFTLLVPFEKNTKVHNETNNYVSIDPGVRTFLTCMANNKVIEIGKKVSKYLYKKINKMDKIRANCKNSKKYIKKHRKKIKNKITDMHWKTMRYFINENITNIHIGNWSTKSCISKKFHLYKKTKRVMQHLRFFEFREKFKFKCEEHNISLKIVDESYTSKTCSNCGIINQNLGSKKVFECPSCNVTIDRDINGCRNILMKSF